MTIPAAHYLYDLVDQIRRYAMLFGADTLGSDQEQVHISKLSACISEFDRVIWSL